MQNNNDNIVGGGKNPSFLKGDSKKPEKIKPSEPKASLKKVDQNYLDLQAGGVDLVAVEKNTNQTDIPTYAYPKRTDDELNRCNIDPTGRSMVFQAKHAERLELKTMLLSILPTNEQYLADFVCFIPNAKMAWANAVIKQAFRDASTDGIPVMSACTSTALANMWMNKEAIDLLKVFINRYIRVRDDIGWTQWGPPPTKGVPISCVPNANGQYAIGITAQNPGFHETQYMDVDDGNACRCSSSSGSSFNRARTDHSNYNNDNNHNNSDMSRDMDYRCNSVISRIQEEVTYDDGLDTTLMDDKYVKLLQQMRRILNSKQFILNDFQRLATEINDIKADSTNLYLASLLFPGTVKDARIPQIIPVPTATFQLKSNINLQTNALGNAAFGWQPFYLAAAGNNNSTFAINNDASLDGISANNNFLSQNIGQVLPDNLYERYRLVSAELKLTFTASSFTSAGYCTTGVTYNHLNAQNTNGTSAVAYENFGSFSEIENTKYKTSVATVQGKQVSTLYLPADESATFFKTRNDGDTANKIVGYVSGAPANTIIARIDIIANYEGIVADKYIDYLPSTMISANHLEFSKAFSSINSNRHNNIMDIDTRRDILRAQGNNSGGTNFTVTVPHSPVEKRETKNKIGEIGKLILNAVKGNALEAGSHLMKEAMGSFHPFGISKGFGLMGLPF